MNNFIRATFLTVTGAVVGAVGYYTAKYEPEQHRENRIEKMLEEQGSSIQEMDKAHIDYLEASKNLQQYTPSNGQGDEAKLEAARDEAEAAYGEQLENLEVGDQAVYNDETVIPAPWEPQLLLRSLSSDGHSFRADGFASEGVSDFRNYKTVEDRMDHQKEQMWNSAMWGAIAGVIAYAFLRKRKFLEDDEEETPSQQPEQEPKRPEQRQEKYPTDLTAQKKNKEAADLVAQKKSKEAADLMLRQSTGLTKQNKSGVAGDEYIDIGYEDVSGQNELQSGQKKLDNGQKQLPGSPKQLPSSNGPKKIGM